MAGIRDVHTKGGELYRRRHYKEAFPYLLFAAREGFKVSQARLSFIYQQGLGGVTRDGESAIGWLGVAASRKSSPEISNYYAAQRELVPEDLVPHIDEIVDSYIAEYGSDATNIYCDNTRPAASHISTLKCDHQLEFEYRDILHRDEIRKLTGEGNGFGNALGNGSGLDSLPDDEVF